MRRSAGEQIKDLLYRQLQTVSEELLQGKEQVSSDQMASLERLMQLVKIHDAAKPSRKRWPVLVIFGFILLTLSFLLFLPVSQTEIEMDLEVSGIGFELPARQVLTDIMELSALGVSGLKNIHIPHARNRIARILSETDNSIHLSPEYDGNQYGTVTLATLIMPEGTRVWVFPMEDLQQYRLTVKGDDLAFRANVHGPLRVALVDAPAEKYHFESPRSIWLHADSHEADLDLTPLDSSTLHLRPQLSISNLSFRRIDEYMDAGRTVIRRASTVLSGTLYFNSLNDRKRSLRPGEMIQFNQSLGDIRTLQMQNGRIALKFQGLVRGMQTGTGENLRSLMPTYLDWLQERHALALFWGATLYFSGLIIGVLRWWGIRL